MSACNSLSPTLESGEESRFYATVRNTGKSDYSGKISITFMIDGKVIDKVEFDGTIESGKNKLIKTEKTWKPWFGSHILKTKIKFSDDGKENSGSNLLKQRLSIAD